MLDNGLNHDSPAGDDIYGIAIPPQTTGTIVHYCVSARDDSNAVVTDSADPGTTLYAYEVGAAAKPLFINKFMADNETAFQDPEGTGYPDWIEIYNAGTEAIDMSGMYLTDNLASPTQLQIPSGVTINGGGYLVFLADNDEIQGPMHTNFKLGASGEAIGLFDTDAGSNLVIDSVTFGQQSVDTSYGRCPNGGDSWSFMEVIDPGYGNDCFICGDANQSGTANILDVTYIISYLYKSGAAPDCP